MSLKRGGRRARGNRRAGHARQRGQALVEFALVLPVFLLVVMAIVDFGWALRSYITITNSAREGARLGVTCVSTDAIKARVVDRSAGLLELADVTGVVNPCPAGDGAVEVTVEYDHYYISPIGELLNFVSGGAVPSPLHMSTTSKMRLE
jgi:Flp pilus assembly protein TadG